MITTLESILVEPKIGMRLQYGQNLQTFFDWSLVESNIVILFISMLKLVYQKLVKLRVMLYYLGVMTYTCWVSRLLDSSGTNKEFLFWFLKYTDLHSHILYIDIVRTQCLIRYLWFFIMHILPPKCKIVHFMKWIRKLTISWNGQIHSHCAIHFMKWSKWSMKI